MESPKILRKFFNQKPRFRNRSHILTKCTCPRTRWRSGRADHGPQRSSTTPCATRCRPRSGAVASSADCQSRSGDEWHCKSECRLTVTDYALDIGGSRQFTSSWRPATKCCRRSCSDTGMRRSSSPLCSCTWAGYSWATCTWEPPKRRIEWMKAEGQICAKNLDEVTLLHNYVESMRNEIIKWSIN